jgi:nuclear transport factor 2 (NTF2) superfamily protein
MSTRRFACTDNAPIGETDRRFLWPLGRLPTIIPVSAT